jgi:hypothetical protein
MAKVERNMVARGIRGTIGNLVFRQSGMEAHGLAGHLISASANSARGRRNTEKAAYARAEAKKEPISAQLASGTTKNAYNIALSDWFNLPVIHRIERRDGCLRVEASDNVMVTKVRVTILDDHGKVLEQSQAVQDPGSKRWWDYVSDTGGKVLTEAWDLAGNVAKREDQAE